MLANLKNTLTSKLALFVMMLMFFWVLVDGIERFTGVSITQNNETEPMVIKPIILPQLNKNELSQINAAYAQYVNDKAENKDEVQQGMSAAEQAKQHGILDALFIGDNQLKLKAVIQNAEKNLVALIEIKNIKSGVTKVERISNNHTVHGYSLVIDKNTQVRLTKQQAQTLQQIILTMYTSKA